MSAPASPSFPAPVRLESDEVERYLERLLAACALAAAVVFIGVGIGRPVWLDEANSVLIASHGFSGIIDSLSRDNNLPLYYFLLSGWMRVFGNSEIAVRSLSAIFYLGGCGAAFALGKRLTGETRAGWYSAFFYEASALAILQAQNIRMYSLLGMLSGLSAWCWLRVIRDRDGSRGAWAWLLAVNSLGLLTHVWFVFVLGGQLAATAVCERRQLGRFVLAGVAAAVPFSVLWGPVFWHQLHNGATGWMPRLQPIFLILAGTEFYGPVASLLLFALAGACAIYAVRKGCSMGIAPLVLIFLASVAVPLAISFVKPIYWPGRYLVIGAASLAAVLGSILAGAPSRLVPALAGLLLLGAQVPAQFAGRDLVPGSQLPPGQSDRTTAEFLLAHAAPGDAIVFTSLSRAAADYYFGRAGAGHRFQEFSFPADTATHLGWMDSSAPPERQTRLEAEASWIAGQAGAIAGGGHAIWVYDGASIRVTELLTRRLNLTLNPRADYRLEGSYHKRILEYRTER
uniref:Membrane protein-like protein n=1 Tax=Solibacter usitatus (strain Ellin6076) TaxID=234267 RepID=Q01PM2_SOLUE